MRLLETFGTEFVSAEYIHSTQGRSVTFLTGGPVCGSWGFLEEAHSPFRIAGVDASIPLPQWPNS